MASLSAENDDYSSGIEPVSEESSDEEIDCETPRMDSVSNVYEALNKSIMKPIGMTVLGRSLFVADGEAKHILVVDLYSGSVLKTIGKGILLSPIDVAGLQLRSGQNVLFCADIELKKIFKFDADTGSQLNTIAGLPLRGHDSEPSGICVKPHSKISPGNRLYICDKNFIRIIDVDEPDVYSSIDTSEIIFGLKCKPTYVPLTSMSLFTKMKREFCVL
jgi:hypothetical protein